jgi:hypothetical protein
MEQWDGGEVEHALEQECSDDSSDSPGSSPSKPRIAVSHLARAIVIRTLGNAESIVDNGELVLFGYARKKSSNPAIDSITIGNWVRGLRNGLSYLGSLDDDDKLYIKARIMAESYLGRPIDDPTFQLEYLQKIRDVWSSNVMVAMNAIRENRNVKIQEPTGEMLEEAMRANQGERH